MKIGFKRGTHFYSPLVRALTTSQFSHAAVLIRSRIYESTALRGSQPTAGVRDYPSTPEIEAEYEWFESCIPDEDALRRYEEIKGKPYDYFSLLSFLLLQVKDSQRFYCYEMVLYLMLDDVSTRVTPELIMQTELELRGLYAR